MRSLSVSLLLSLALSSLVAAQQQPFQVPAFPESLLSGERYDGQSVWRVDWRGLNEGAKREVMDVIELLDLDVWHTTRSSIDLRVSQRQLQVLHGYLPASAFQPFIPDLQSLIETVSSEQYLVDESAGDEMEAHGGVDAERKKKNKKKQPTAPAPTPEPIDPFNLTTLATPFHDAFHPLEEVYKFGEVLVSTFNGKEGIEVKELDIGTTYEGRQIKGWTAKMAQNQSQGVPKDQLKGSERRGRNGREEIDEALELEFVVQSGQHGREWVGPSSALYFLHALILHATSQPESDSATLLRSFRFTVIPNINPDGYAYSREHSRMWRKNRQDVGGKNGKCVGIDLNSNWGYKWRTPRHASACSETYPGHEAFEANETRAVSDYLLAAESRGSRIRAFIDLHSYGQLFMFPFAHSCDDFPPDAEMLMEAGLGVAKAMRNKQGEGYEAGQACDLTYRAPGDAIDFAYGVTDIRWSYSAELRDTGTYGFMLPPKLIRPTADEITAGLHYLAKFMYVQEVNPPQTPRLAK
ncbi:hypothetical protein IAU60_005167 [Kwoniella sp. DSM 27419]